MLSIKNESLQEQRRNLEQLRKSEALLSYKMAMLSSGNRVQSFPCVDCHSSYKDTNEQTVVIGVDCLSLKNVGKEFLLENGWMFDSKNKNTSDVFFKKKQKDLKPLEWCCLYCRKGIRISPLSDKQLMCYEQVRPVDAKLQDIEEYRQIDCDFFENFKRETFPVTYLLVMNRNFKK